MPRGRHRHSPPLHRLLPPSAIAGVSLVCALGPWVFTEPSLLRGLAAAAAATAVGSAFVMRRWDIQAGKQVADLTRARAGDEWRYEERVAELESDLEESRELRMKLEQRLRAKRAELAGLRNEHASLLRRYATAETERASALEGRRLLEIESGVPALALPPARDAQDDATEAAKGADGTEAEVPETGTAEAPDATGTPEAAEDPDATGTSEAAEDGQEAPAVFSPSGSKLFLRAQAALARFDTDGPKPARSTATDAASVDAEPVRAAEPADSGVDAEAAREDEVEGKPEAVDEHARATAPHLNAEANGTAEQKVTPEEPTARTKSADTAPAEDTEPAEQSEAAQAVEPPVTATVTETAAETRETGAFVARPAAPLPTPAQRPSGHFTVPTAVAVVPATQPVRRPTAEGGFDFFGAEKASASAALEAVQNEDLADVVGEEALALHKAEAEAEFKPAREHERAVGQVIDLTAHDETEQIDVQGLRSAVS
ncbi:hypothetical protein OG342_22990 [Streptomyces bobili]|uniref:hypothetical protein n=1 Tax=Streptomyces bobili TaxID=67280 RepID=UPI00225B56E7|nr:hypothetical protein [Streptomyces bobili]MCX5525682.1 hypothetical protein [Streptomyces bobili]